MNTISDSHTTTSQQPTTETVPLILLVGQALFLAFAFSLLNIATYTLFLVDYGSEALPYVYIAIAVFVSLFSFGYVGLQKRWALSTLALSTFVGFAALFFLAWGGLVYSKARWLSFGLMVAITLMELMAMILLGNQAGRLFNVRQMKRLFPFVITGTLIGYIGGGVAVTPLLTVIGQTEHLFLVCGISTLLAVGLLQVTILKFKTILSPAEKTDTDGAPKVSLKQMFSQRYVLMIFFYQMFSAIGTQLVRYLYFTKADAQYPDAEALAQFFGRLTVVRDSSSFLFSSLLAGRLLNRYGLKFGLAANPIGVGLVVVGMAVLGAFWGEGVNLFFWFAVGAYLMDVIFTDGTTSTTVKTSYQVLPSEQRSAVETTVEGIGVPISIGLTGVILLAFKAFPILTLTHITFFTVLIVIAWTVLGFFVYGDYPAMLRKALATRGIQGVELGVMGEAELAILKEGLTSPHVGVVIYSLDMLEGAKPDLLKTCLPPLLDHAEAGVRLDALRRIERLRLTELNAVLQQKLPTETIPAVQGAILRTLAELGTAETGAMVARYLDAPQPDIQRGAMVGLLRSAASAAKQSAHTAFLGRLHSPDPQERIFATRVLGEAGISEFAPQLIELLQDPDRSVRKHALESAGKLNHPQLWPLIVKALHAPETRTAAMAALIAGGESALLELQAAFVNEQQNPPVLIALAQICGQVGGEQVIALLQERIDAPEERVRTQILRSLTLCGYHAPDTDLDRLHQQFTAEIQEAARLLAMVLDIGDTESVLLLRRALEDELRRVRERCFYLLSCLYETRSVLQAQDNLNLGSQQKAYALEVLDILVMQELKKLLFPLLESDNLERQFSALNAIFPQHRRHREERLREIITAAKAPFSPWIRMCALYALNDLDLPVKEVVEIAVAALSIQDPLLQETALWVLLRLNPDGVSQHIQFLRQATHPKLVRLIKQIDTGAFDTSGVSTTIERVLFLRGVALFSQISDEDLIWIEEMAQDVHFTMGEQLITQGETGECLFITTTGSVDIVVNGVGKVATRGEREVYGEMAILAQSHRTANCIAATAVTAMKIEREQFVELLQVKPELALGIIQTLVRRLEEVSRKAAR